MILPWRKPRPSVGGPKEGSSPQPCKADFLPALGQAALTFRSVELQPAIQSLSLSLKSGDWLCLLGTDDFAKALLCDLAFNFIQPDGGTVQPAFKKSEAGFLGRAFTTYGHSLLEHLNSGVKSGKKEWLEQVVSEVLGPRFRRHLHSNKLEFKEGRSSQDLELDERDYLELAEANFLLQRKKGVVIETGSDLYRNAWKLGFRHSKLLLNSGVTIFWIVPKEGETEFHSYVATESRGKTIYQVSFPPESPPGYIN